MGGGGKTKTYTAIKRTKMFKDDEDLFFKNILRGYAVSKSLDPMMHLHNLINNVNLFLNDKTLERFGVIVGGSLISNVITDEIIKRRIAYYLNLYSNDISLYGKFTRDSNNKIITGETIAISEFLNSEYNYAIDYEKEIIEEYTIDGQVVTFSEKVYKYDINNDGNYYEFDSYEPNGDGSYRITLKREITVTNQENQEETIIETITIDTPIDERIFFLIRYKINGSNEYSYKLLKRNELETLPRKRNAILYVLKRGGNYVAQSNRYKKVLYYKFGLNGKDPETGETFDDQFMNDSVIKDVAITTSTDFNNSKYKNLITDIYGTYENPINVEYRGEVIIKYWWNRSGLKISYNGTHVGSGNDDDSMIIIPLDFLQRLPLREKYEAIKDLYSIVIRAVKKIKKKWYQTLFFQFVFFIIGFIFNPVITITTFAVSTIVGSFIKNKYIKLAVQAALIVYGGYKTIQSGKATLLDTVKFSIQLTNELFQFRIQSLTDKITKQISQIQKETQDYSEQIQETQRKALYQPLDLVDTYYEMLYNAQYDQLGMLELSYAIDASIYEPY